MSCRGATPAKAQVNRPRPSADRKADSGWTFSKSTRPPFNDNLVLYVTRRLTDRDRTILDLLADHRVLTSDQLTDAFFDSATTARHRLTKLHQLRVVQRFAPFVSKGSAPYHYVLDRLGAEVVAAERGVEAKKLWKQDRSLVLARTTTLQRIVGINGVFTALMHEARWSDSRDLSLWWSAARCAEWAGDLVKPDGYGIWSVDGLAQDFFVEWDRGEPPEAWVERLGSHADLADALERHVWVLVVATSLRRETDLRRHLDRAGICAATTTRDAHGSPLGNAWLPVDGTRREWVLDRQARGGRVLGEFRRPRSSWPAWLYRNSAPALGDLITRC
jgi:predicted transcriptional regulator